jgi:glycosyltransferase involved in cell wall biosynthesis
VRALRRTHPRRSIGAVETPDEAAPGEVTVLGWAHVPNDPVGSVVVTIDGRPAALARLGLLAPDVGRARRSREAGWSGWAAAVDLSQYPAQRVVIGAIATTVGGLAEVLTPRFVQVGHAGPEEQLPEEHLSVKALALAAPDVLFLSGVTATRLLPSRVEIIIDGHPAGRARLLAGLTPELESLSCVQAPIAGFTHLVERQNAVPGTENRVEAVVTMIDGTVRRIGPIVARVPERRVPPPDASTLRARVVERARDAPTRRVPKLRLLVVTHSLTLGGGQLFLFELLRGLIPAPDVSCVVVAPCDGPLRTQFEALGATVHLVGEYPVDSPAAYESRLVDLVGLARYHGSNVAIVNTLGASIGADLACILAIPYVWAVHESFRPPLFWAEAFGPEGYDHVRARGIDAIRNANAMVFEADATRQLFEDYADPERLITLPYGIGLTEIDDFRNSSAARGVPARGDGSVELLVVGTFEPRKAQARVALAFSRVADEFPETKLIMVGAGDDAYTRGVRDVVRRLHLGDRIRLVPVTGDLYEWYSRADVLVSASDIESLPRSVLEAMAFDVPVIAASVFGLPEIITDGADGLLMEPRDVDGLVTGLRRVLELEPGQRAALGRAGGKRVRTQFGSVDYIDVWARLLHALVDDPQARPAAALESSGRSSPTRGAG